MGGMYVAAGFITAALMFTLATFRWHPDLRGADLEPQADTGAMPIIDLRQEI
jgi:hypothetical protein